MLGAMARSTRNASSLTRAESPFGRTILVTGPEALLADRAVAESEARAHDEQVDVEISYAEAGQLDAGTLAEITGGSLFASRRMAVVRGLSDLPTELVDQVVALASSPDPDIALVLVHPGGVKGKGLLDKLRKLKGSVEVVDCPSLKAYELAGFVSAEFRRIGARADEQAAQLLVDAVGQDLRGLAAAVRQLHADAGDAAITADVVRTYFAGRSEVTGFAVTDAALAGRTTKALEQLRWALATGTSPVLLTSALASGLRGLGRLLTAPGGLRDADLARDVGVPSWKLRSMRSQLRGWDQRGIARALVAVARADADVKGAAENAEFALERALLEVSRARR